MYIPANFFVGKIILNRKMLLDKVDVVEKTKDLIALAPFERQILNTF